MTKAFSIFLLLASVAVAADTFSPVSALQIARKLGPGCEVVEVRNREVLIGRPYLGRLEFSASEVVATTRNDGAAPLASAFRLQLLNSYGMLLCTLDVSYAEEPIEPGKVRARVLPISFPSLETVFASSSLSLPADWRDVKFVGVILPASSGSKLNPTTSSSVTKARIPSDPSIRNRTDKAKMGLSGIDAKWSNFGAYLQRLIDTIQIQWERLILTMPSVPKKGSTVVVKFAMNNEGRITEVISLESSADELASRACVSAITDRSPYGPWTDNMRKALGFRQEMTFTFRYE